MKQAYITLLTAVFTFPTWGQDTTLVRNSDSVLSVKAFPLEGGKGSVYVVIRKDGHIAARPYIIELRPSCGAQNADWRTLQVADSRSVCDIAPETSTLNESYSISVMVRDVNSAKLEKSQRMTASKSDINVCNTKGRAEKISTRDFCK